MLRINFELFFPSCKEPRFTIAFDIPVHTKQSINDRIIQRKAAQQEQQRQQAILPVEPELVKTVRELAASNRVSFELCSQGLGGTYFVKDSTGAAFAVFKAGDEEPGASKNPKGNYASPILPPGGGAVREVIAYLLDQGRAGVPPTYLMEDLRHSNWLDKNGIPESKTGSLQEFIQHDGVAADMGASLFCAENVHNVGILDLRLFNLDRNGENLLVVNDKSQPRLVPIDHAYSLPPSVQNPYFEWLHWKQAKVPFSPETLAYISSIDIKKDAEILRSFSISEESIRTMIVSTTLLKKGAASGLTLFQIASMACGDGRSDSQLAVIVDKAQNSAAGNSGIFFEIFDKLIDESVRNVVNK